MSSVTLGNQVGESASVKLGERFDSLGRARRRTLICSAWGAVYVVVLLFFVLVIRPQTLPDEPTGMTSASGPINSTLLQLGGERVHTDFLVEYVSADALRDGIDPYIVGWQLIDRSGGPAWGVSTGNPHPPTMIVMVLPFTVLSYENALAAFALLMVFALIATIYLMGVPFHIALAVGAAGAFLYPASYGIGNAVPMIGLGIAVAYRFRHEPWLAAVGITLAAAPKSSGLLLLLPFALSFRWRTVAWTGLFIAVLAALPMLWYRAVWARYLDAGVEGIRRNAARLDNASLLKVGPDIGLSETATSALLVLATLIFALWMKDSFWPVVWLTVAALPIAWIYSLLTFMPLWLASIRSGRRLPVTCTVLAIGLLLATPPNADWPPRTVPIIILVSAISLLGIREASFWVATERWARLLRIRRELAPESLTSTRHR